MTDVHKVVEPQDGFTGSVAYIDPMQKACFKLTPVKDQVQSVKLFDYDFSLALSRIIIFSDDKVVLVFENSKIGFIDF